jgi:hypothetical protein
LLPLPPATIVSHCPRIRLCSVSTVSYQSIQPEAPPRAFLHLDAQSARARDNHAPIGMRQSGRFRSACPRLPAPPPTPPTSAPASPATIAIESRTEVARVSIPGPISVAIAICGSIPVPVAISAAPVASRCRFNLQCQKRGSNQSCQEYQSTLCHRALSFSWHQLL